MMHCLFAALLSLMLAFTAGCQETPARGTKTLNPVLPAGAEKFLFGDKVRVQDVPATRVKGAAGRVGNIAGFTRPSFSREEVIGDVKNDLAFSVIFENPDAQLWFAPELLEFVGHTVMDIKIERRK